MSLFELFILFSSIFYLYSPSHLNGCLQFLNDLFGFFLFNLSFEFYIYCSVVYFIHADVQEIAIHWQRKDSKTMSILKLLTSHHFACKIWGPFEIIKWSLVKGIAQGNLRIFRMKVSFVMSCLKDYSLFVVLCIKK